MLRVQKERKTFVFQVFSIIVSFVSVQDAVIKNVLVEHLARCSRAIRLAGRTLTPVLCSAKSLFCSVAAHAQLRPLLSCRSGVFPVKRGVTRDHPVVSASVDNAAVRRDDADFD